MEIELNEVDQTASTEANSANAANDGDTSEEDSLIDYNEEDDIKVAQKAAEQKALKEMLTFNGFTLRNILRSEKVKQHFTRRHTFGNPEGRPTWSRNGAKAYLYASIFHAEVSNSHNQSA